MYDILNDVVSAASSSEIVEAAVVNGCVVLIIVLCVATIDLISQFISIFSRIK